MLVGTGWFCRISVSERKFTRKHTKAKVLANVLTSIHCGYEHRLRMRHRLNIWQPGIHSPLCSRYESGSQFGRVTDGCIHSAGRKPTHTLRKLKKKRRPFNKTSIFKRTFWVYIPSGNSTCVNDMDRHRGGAEHCCSSSAILPGHNRVAPVKRPRQASDQCLSRAAGSLRARQRRSCPIPAEHPAGDASSIENNYWMKKKKKKKTSEHEQKEVFIKKKKKIYQYFYCHKHVKLNGIHMATLPFRLFLFSI